MTTWIACTVLQAAFCIPPALAVVIQAVNMVLTPVQLICFPIFVHEGEALLGADHVFDVKSLDVNNARHGIYYGLISWLGFLPIGMLLIYGGTVLVAAHARTTGQRIATIVVTSAATSAVVYSIFHPATRLWIEDASVVIIACVCALSIGAYIFKMRSKDRQFTHMKTELELIKERI
jgi:hypothetical protein